jgi:hypothetical protein
VSQFENGCPTKPLSTLRIHKISCVLCVFVGNADATSNKQMIAEEKTAFIRILLRCCAKDRRMVSVLFLLSGEGRGDKLVIPASISELQELYNEW